MNRNIAAFITAIILGTTLVATASGMQQDGWARRRGSGVLIRRIEHRLNITDAQRDAIKQILRTEQPTIQSLAQRVRQQNNELAAQTSFDEAQVRSFAQQHEATMEDVLVEREKVRFELLQVLTPEQREQLSRFRTEHSKELVDRLSSLADQI
jgi:Spy/CpxP family protein refolding chaperone